MSAVKSKHPSAIAIVGMAGRYPGARNLDEFWRNLRAGVESLTRFSDEELLASGVDPLLLANPAYVKAGTVLERADEFDATFFGINPREAGVMDPQQRLFLECAWEALEDAGYDGERLKAPVGVFAGSSMNTYIFANLMANPEMLASVGAYQMMIGNDKDFLATRVSYKLNLRGPAFTVQTACSTSLVAVHLACENLLTHQCDMALAGGVALLFPQRSGYLFQEGMIFSPDAHVRPFDEKGRGIRSGEGVGIVVLKRLEDALAAGDSIRAVILGTAINNDGAQKIGYTAPSVDGQAEVIAAAQSIAAVEPGSISYVEAHGTATPLGDPIEIAALTKAFGASVKRQSCAIGSVKSNIGHLDAAAGVTGLIKTVLAMQHREIPPSLNFQRPNPQIDFAASPFFVNAQLRSWTVESGSRRAGVSSFGIGGTNAHAVLEEAPASVAQERSERDELLVLSAKSASALDAASQRLADFLEAHPQVNLTDVAYTLQSGRRVFEHRRVVLARDSRSLREALTTDRRRVLSGRRESGTRNVAFMFSGQGSQHLGMGARTYQTEPVFRDIVDECARKLLPHLGVDLRTVLYPEFAAGQGLATDSGARINDTALAQPALFVTEYALARLWMERGVQPQAMLGHSIGEYAAACLAGVFSLDSALEIVAARGRLMQSMAPGSMLAVPVSETDAAPYLNEHLAVAAINAPGMCVVSGPTDAIDKLERELEAAGLAGRKLRTSHAFHSAMMQPAVAPFVEIVARHQLAAPRIPFVSNLTGTWITEAQATDPAYWGNHLRSAVRFADGVRTLAQDAGRLLLEVGPGATLKTLARQTLAGTPDDAILTSLPPVGERMADDEFLLLALGRAWLAGAPVRWEALHHERQARRVPLPTYPFEGQRCWVDPAPRQTGQTVVAAGAAAAPVRAADLADWFWVPSWQRAVSLEAFGATAAVSPGRWLVFADDTPVCAAVLAQLAARGVELVTVRVGARFAALTDTEYQIVPDSRADYVRLAEAVLSKAPLTCIAHLWNTSSAGSSRLDVEQGRRLGFYSLMYLAQAWDECYHGTAVPLLALSTDLQQVVGDEVVDPARSLMLGPAFVASQDLALLRSRLIDLSSKEWLASAATGIAAALLAEAQEVGDFRHKHVAWRGGYRWISTLSALHLSPAVADAGPLRERGVYLITGGLSGIGLAVATHLASTVRARLVLISRSSLPERSQWSELLGAAGTEEGVKARIRAVQALESLGAEVLVVSADVTDEAAIQSAVRAARDRFGAINGVFHAAGLPGDGRLLQLKTPEETESVLKPKVEGTVILDRVLEGANLDFLLLCSSINSAFGWHGTTDYTAANAFMDAFAHSGLARSTGRVIAINWAAWAETGMAARIAVANGHDGAEDFVQRSIGVADGLQALRRALGARVKQVYVSPRAMPDLIAESEQVRRAWQIEGHKVAPVSQSAASASTDASRHTRPPLETDYLAPETSSQRTLCGIWEDLLGVQPVGIRDNFFELGGHSLLATRVLARIQGAFGIRLTLREIFDAPTVQTLAERIDAARGGSAVNESGAESEEEREEIEL